MECEIDIDTSESIDVVGVIKTPIQSLGTVLINIFVDNLIIAHTFHVMPNHFNIPCDGIIGKDLNKLYNCILDYGQQTYTIRTEKGNATIPIKMHTRNNELTLPPRAETTRIFTFSIKTPILIKSILQRVIIECCDSFS